MALRAEVAPEGLRQTGQRGMEQNPLCSAFPSHISFPGPPAPLPQAQEQIYILIETPYENYLNLAHSCLEGFSLVSSVLMLSGFGG